MFTDRISRIKPSATLEMTSKAAELKRANKPVYNMSVGEPDFSTPENIQKAAIWAINNGHTKYTPGGGTLELKETKVSLRLSLSKARALKQAIQRGRTSTCAFRGA